jgi:hypothetical protein
MAVIEYMMVRDRHTRQVPEFVGDRGHWYSSVDHTFIGWVDDNRDYYVPDTIVYLTREQFIARQLAIHAVVPWTKFKDEKENFNPGAEKIDFTIEEVTAISGTWYDGFVAANQPA